MNIICDRLLMIYPLPLERKTMAKILSGKEVSQTLSAKITARAKDLIGRGIRPRLATVRLGENPAALSYEKGLLKSLPSLNIDVETFFWPETISEEELVEGISDLGRRNDIHGILLLLPLPVHCDEDRVVTAIPPEKDIDGLRMDNLGKILAYRDDGFNNCAIDAVMAIIDHYGIDLSGKRVCLLGAGRLINRPLSMLLLRRKATVTLTNTKTRQLEKLAAESDILISAMGRAGSVDEKFIRPGQIVIDVGTAVVDGKLRGDLDIERTGDRLAAYTPTPGGVSSLTTRILADHLVTACERAIER